MAVDIDVFLPEKVAEAFEGEFRYRGLYGGRGSGKSIGAAKMAVIKAACSKIRILCCRELQNSIKDSVHSLIVEQIEQLGLKDLFEYGESYIRAKNGSEFLFKGLRTNSAEIKSMNNIQICWVEEAQSVSQRSLDYLLPTIRADNSEIWFCWNPLDEQDPVHDMLVNNKPDNAIVRKINYSDNPFFPSVLEQERLRTLKFHPQRYEWIWEGNFNTNTDGSVYGKWLAQAERQGRYRTGLYDPSLPVHTAWDLGFSDDTAIWFFQIAKNEVRLIDYYENNREGIKHYCEQLYGNEIIVLEYGDNGKVLKWEFGPVIESAAHRTKYKYASHNAPHDAANKLLQAGGRSIVHQAFELGIKFFVVPATSQQNQIEAARTTITFSYFDTERCKDGIRALRKYQFLYDEERGKYLDKPDHDAYSHGCDAYEIIAQVWKSVTMPVEKVPRFFEDQTANELFWPENTGQQGNDRI